MDYLQKRLEGSFLPVPFENGSRQNRLIYRDSGNTNDPVIMPKLLHSLSINICGCPMLKLLFVYFNCIAVFKVLYCFH